jgi:hypothetical protein
MDIVLCYTENPRLLHYDKISRKKIDDNSGNNIVGKNNNFVLRSWVQFPPSPLFPVVQLWY